MARGFVVSDLHIFSNRSAFAQHVPELEQALGRADVFVFNGDTFDFRWSMLPNLTQTVQAAVELIAGYAGRFANCRFHLLLGNHDSHPRFAAAISEQAAASSNLSIYPSHLQLGDKLFIHGDAIHAPGGLRELNHYRSGFHEEASRSAFMKSCYDALVALRIHRLFGATLKKEETVERLVAFINVHAPGLLQKVRHIYFGHTHQPFSDYAYRDWVFHNSGAMVKGIGFRLLEFEC